MALSLKRKKPKKADSDVEREIKPAKAAKVKKPAEVKSHKAPWPWRDYTFVLLFGLAGILFLLALGASETFYGSGNLVFGGSMAALAFGLFWVTLFGMAEEKRKIPATIRAPTAPATVAQEVSVGPVVTTAKETSTGEVTFTDDPFAGDPPLRPKEKVTEIDFGEL